MENWIDVNNEFPEPGKTCLAFFRNSLGNGRIIKAIHVPPLTIEEEEADDAEFSEYDEKTDAYYLPEGWYEHNEFDECHWCVEGKITHWMPLPKPPVE